MFCVIVTTLHMRASRKSNGIKILTETERRGREEGRRGSGKSQGCQGRSQGMFHVLLLQHFPRSASHKTNGIKIFSETERRGRKKAAEEAANPKAAKEEAKVCFVLLLQHFT